MGLLDDLGKAVGGSTGNALGNAIGQGASPSGAGQGALLQAVMALLQNGGLEKLVASLRQGGLGDVVGSWISTGKNLPVAPDQLAKALGPDTLGTLARQAGLDSNALSGQLANLLPGLVDRLTPGGALPDRAGLEKGLGMLKGLL